MHAEASSGHDRPASRRPEGEARKSALPWFERFVPIHVTLLIVGISWSFGGQIGWARQLLLAWGSVGILLFLLLGWRNRRENRAAFAATARDLWPLGLFAVLVGVSCFNPSFATVTRDSESFREVVAPPFAWLPSSARPLLSATELWQFLGIVLSCYNLGLVASRRRTLRLVLLLMAANGLTLAIFGTLQKLVDARGLWFGAVPSPQPYFFSTF
ncbi:MAG TPA: hypothetical protein VFJ90_05180, partial [Candidatus Didemnitutus sp.]|nr:hypothetical protein [Candidatus Didemnitutus sp.]